jgi:hypothetical protein
MTKTAGTATFTGNVKGASLTLDGAGGTLNLGAGLYHTFTGAWTRTAGTLEGGSSTIRLNGHASGTGASFTPGTSTFIYGSSSAQNVAALTYHNLKFVVAGTKTALGNIATNGYLRVESGSSFTIGAFDLTVGGTTTVTGTLTFSSPTGSKIFTGLVTVNSGGTWKNDAAGNAEIHFRGGLTNNATNFLAGTGMYYFETNDQAVGGTKAIAIPSVTIEVGRTLTNNNSGGFNVTTLLTGGSVVQGVTGILGIGMPGANFTIASLDASAVGNTVNFSYVGDQTVLPIPYHSLSLSGSGEKTLPVGFTHLSGNLSLGGTAFATTGDNLDLDGNLVVDDGATLFVGNFNFNVDGTTTITGDLNLCQRKTHLQQRQRDKGVWRVGEHRSERHLG